jgi:tRNA(Ile)-lysidine synthase
MHDHGGDLTGKAVATIKKYEMLKGGERVVVSVSGGPDSVALLHFLADIADGMGLTLSVFHADHMLRGDESRADAAFTGELAGRLGLESVLVTIDVKGEIRRTGRSPQDAARALRLERLLEHARDWGADRIAVGHTADDQVETFLMRVVQGAGLTGLASIGPVSGPVIRPLIEVWRVEVEQYLLSRRIEARQDSTNLELNYLRNRIRLKLLPCFVEEFGEAVKQVILRDVESLALDREYFQVLAGRALEDAAGFGESEVRIDRNKLLEMAPSLQRGVLRAAWTKLVPEEPVLNWQHAVDINRRVVLGATGAMIDLPCDSVAEREYDDIVIRRREQVARKFGPVPLTAPGSVELPWGQVIEADYVDADSIEFALDPGTEYARGDLRMPLTVRTPEPGDRFRPLGSPYQRKLKDFFIDIKLPRRNRRAVALVLEDERVVWVAGLRLDDRYRLGPADGRAIRLRLRAGL